MFTGYTTIDKCGYSSLGRQDAIIALARIPERVEWWGIQTLAPPL